MAKIQQLDAHLTNMIAAGEVVERPMGVIKELVENALDAQATRIEVNINQGGTELMEVIDNGIGISKEKLKEIRKRLNGRDNEGHIGIYNCNRRLALTFGEGYGLTVRSKRGMGSIFTVVFPAE